jgi:hypothetical protein
MPPKNQTLHSLHQKRSVQLMKPHLAILALLLFALSCSRQQLTPPAGVMQPRAFAKLYADLLKHSSRVPAPPSDTITTRREVDSILQIHGTNRDAVETSILWYNQNAEMWKSIMDSVTANLEREQASRP